MYTSFAILASSNNSNNCIHYSFYSNMHDGSVDSRAIFVELISLFYPQS